MSSNRERLREAKAFVEAQVGGPISLAAMPGPVPESSINEVAGTLRDLGFLACVPTEYGVIDDKGDEFWLARWRFEGDSVLRNQVF